MSSRNYNSTKFSKKQAKSSRKNKAESLERQSLITLGVETSPKNAFSYNVWGMMVILLVQELQRMYFIFHPKVKISQKTIFEKL